MGLYNEVSYRCPDCGTEIIDQTKSGSCTLSTFYSNSVPPEELEGLEKEVYCGNCHAKWEVVSNLPRNVMLNLIHAE